jgi:hypothetical protein
MHNTALSQQQHVYAPFVAVPRTRYKGEQEEARGKVRNPRFPDPVEGGHGPRRSTPRLGRAGIVGPQARRQRRGRHCRGCQGGGGMCRGGEGAAAVVAADAARAFSAETTAFFFLIPFRGDDQQRQLRRRDVVSLLPPASSSPRRRSAAAVAAAANVPRRRRRRGDKQGTHAVNSFRERLQHEAREEGWMMYEQRCWMSSQESLAWSSQSKQSDGVVTWVDVALATVR